MWTLGYDQVLDEPASTTRTQDEGRSSLVPSISQIPSMKLQSNTGQISVDSDAESDEGEGKGNATSSGSGLPPQTEQSFDDDGEFNGNKDTIDLPNAPLLNSPTGSDKFIVVSDVEILEAKAGNTNNEMQSKSAYLDLKEG